MSQSVAAVGAPDRSLQQRLDALREANRVRCYRSAMKRSLVRDRVAPVVALSRALDDELCASMRVIELLVALPKVGRVKATKALSVAGVSPAKTLGGMTDRQRRELLSLVSVFPSASGRTIGGDGNRTNHNDLGQGTT